MAINSASAADEGGPSTIDNEEVEPCIHKVPKHLLKVNEEAYSPLLISIGPYYHGKQELIDMEKHKIRYKDEFDKRITQDKQEELKNLITKKEKLIRRHYAEPFEILSDDFVNIILHDAVFIIELFLKFSEDIPDSLLHDVWLEVIRRDLQLLQNQLPFFVLEEFYNIVLDKFDEDGDSVLPFRTLSCFFFRLHLSHNIPPFEEPAVKIHHFTDLCRYALVEISPKFKGVTYLDSLPNAVKLKTSGVKFNFCYDKYLVDIILEKRRRLISFSDALELQIPCIEITYHTECLIRNVMALEQCHYPSETYICSYIELLNSLIKIEKDVDLLVEEGIIYNLMGDNAAIADMFNKLCLQIPPSRYSYYSTCYNDLLDHYNSRWNRAKAAFKRIYIKLAAAFVLFTVIQAVFSVLQVFLLLQSDVILMFV